MKRADAFALVRKHGGKPREGVTKQTDVLVVGELGWPLLDDGRPSNSLAQAKSYRIPVASERQFLEWLGRSIPEEGARTYTVDQLAALSKLPKDVVDQLAMFGLIEARGGRFGFRDLAAARQVAGLLAAGTALSAITRSLNEIRKWLPDARLSNLRLFPESSDRLLVEQMKGRTDKTGQFVLNVEEPRNDADAIFQDAQSAEASGDAATAEQLYRRAMNTDPADPVAPYNLGNVLRAMGRSLEAEAAYRTAVKADPCFAQAWYNLADLLDVQRRTDGRYRGAELGQHGIARGAYETAAGGIDGRALKAGDQRGRGRLPAAGRADEHHEFLVLDLDVEVLHDSQVCRIALHDVVVCD